MGRLIDIDRLCNDLAKRWSIADKKKEDLIRAVMADVVTPIVVSQPTVDAVPVKHGRWIIRTRHEHYPSGRAYEEIVCPFCGKVDHNGDGDFCGYCGAKMDRKDGGDG